jgi:hypothetical protein
MDAHCGGFLEKKNSTVFVMSQYTELKFNI